MTERLQKVVAELSALPPKEQDAVADLLLQELAWDKSFKKGIAGTKLEEMAEEAHQEYLAGKTEPLDF